MIMVPPEIKKEQDNGIYKDNDIDTDKVKTLTVCYIFKILMTQAF